jgi:hypothetical protein
MLITRFEAHTISTFSPAFKLIAALITIASLALPAWIHQMFPGRTASRLAVATTDAVPAFRPA